MRAIEDNHNPKKDVPKRKIYLLLLIAAIAVFVVCAFLLITYMLNGSAEEDAYSEIRGSTDIEVQSHESATTAQSTAMEPTQMQSGMDIGDGKYYYDLSFTDAYATKGHKNIALLQEDYPLIAAWLYIPGTNVSYPVMAADGDEYLTQNFKGESAKSGSLFCYTSNFNDPGSKNLTIYGHNMKNGSMFGSLKAYLLVDGMMDGAYKIYLDTSEGSYVYEIFSVYIAPATGPQSQSYFDDDDELTGYLKECEGKSLVQPDEECSFSASSQILTLSTCTSLHGAGEDDRLIVQAVRQ